MHDSAGAIVSRPGTTNLVSPATDDSRPPTRMQCPEGSLHDRIVKQWPFVRSYAIRNGHLHLSLMADGGNYEFEPLSPQKK